MKGRGLGLMQEVRGGRETSRAKRWRVIMGLSQSYDWPHGCCRLRSWKKHRLNQWKGS